MPWYFEMWTGVSVAKNLHLPHLMLGGTNSKKRQVLDLVCRFIKKQNFWNFYSIHTCICLTFLWVVLINITFVTFTFLPEFWFMNNYLQLHTYIQLCYLHFLRKNKEIHYEQIKYAFFFWLLELGYVMLVSFKKAI